MKPFLIVLLGLLFATSLTRIDPQTQPATGPACSSAAQPILILYGPACGASHRAAPQNAMAVALFPRGSLSRQTAVRAGLALPLLLFAAAFVMWVGRLDGRARLVGGTLLLLAGGYAFAVLSMARYGALLHEPWQRLEPWLSDPVALRVTLCWLASGVAAAAGLWLLTRALLSGRRQDQQT